MISFQFPADMSAAQVAQKLAYWATVLTEGDRFVKHYNAAKKKEAAEVVSAVTDARGRAMPEEAADEKEIENIVSLAKEAKKRNGKAAPKEKKEEKLTVASVRSQMIDYVNVASQQMKADRKDVFLGLLGEFGVRRLDELPEDRLPEMVALVEKRTGELESMKAGK